MCFAALVGLSKSALATVNENLAYTYYQVNVDSASSLRKALNSASPFKYNGRIFHGHTDWHISWHFWWDERPDGRCSIKRVSVDFTSTIGLPQLMSATTAQQNQFNTYVTALRTHELGHVNVGKSAAYAIDQAIFNLPEMASCSRLGAAANDIGNRMLSDYQAREIRYDAETEHGKTQGAWLDR